MTVKNQSHPTPVPLLDNSEAIYDQEHPSVQQLSHSQREDFLSVVDFLKQYDGNPGTYNAYRREMERLLQWSFLIAQKSITHLDRQDLENYIQFCLDPPKNWIGLKRVVRFVIKDGVRQANSSWRPFIASVSKVQHRLGIWPDKKDYSLSPKAIREIFTITSSFYNYMVLQGKSSFNPVTLIRQKSRYLRKRQGGTVIPKLTELQWSYCIDTAEQMAADHPAQHERTLFMMTALYLLYLRISELVASDRWVPTMGDFFQDAQGNWWFKTVGKGNKERDISVSQDMLKALARYRKYRLLSPALPMSGERTPLIPKLRGVGPLYSERKARDIVQACFDQSVLNMRSDGFSYEADALMQATVHWLRHTGISDDINKRGRPIIHVRDDAGHSTVATTDRYNDADREERHRSGWEKKAKLD